MQCERSCTHEQEHKGNEPKKAKKNETSQDATRRETLLRKTGTAALWMKKLSMRTGAKCVVSMCTSPTCLKDRPSCRHCSRMNRKMYITEMLPYAFIRTNVPVSRMLVIGKSASTISTEHVRGFHQPPCPFSTPAAAATAAEAPLSLPPPPRASSASPLTMLTAHSGL